MFRSDVRRVRSALTLALVPAMLTACASAGAPAPVADLKPAERPASNSNEAGLWMQGDRSEVLLRTSGTLVRDPMLQAYIQGIACRVAGPHCDSIRVYVVRTPRFYASMSPNGMMRVGTGLLLRVANEAQLAFVLGHEIGHYLRRHSLQRWEDLKAKSANIANERDSIAAFSRENEREADQLGYELLVKAGYDPREAPRAWERLAAERAARSSTPPNPFFATHPTSAERIKTLRDYAEGVVLPTAEPRTGRAEFVAHLGPILGRLLTDEVRGRQFQSSETLLGHLITDGDRLGDLHFYMGEIYRLRDQGDDLSKAVEAYQRALDFAEAPPETLRSLGIIHLRRRDRPAAQDAFARYLERRPNAADREMIQSQIAELQASP